MRKIYTAVFLGISLFAILGLALGPTLQTAVAHNAGKLKEHCTAHVGFPNSICGLGSPTTPCTTKSGASGTVHFVDIDGDTRHGHDDPITGERGEPTFCIRSR